MTIDNNLNKNDIAPPVSVVIPNRTGMPHLSYSLESLRNTKYRNYQVVLVDDGSTDGSLSYVKNNHDKITILDNNGKRGFAGSVNTGIRHALEHGASYIAVFNNDIRVLPEWIELTLNVFAKGKRIGLVGFTEIVKENEELFYNSTVSRDTIVCREVKRLAGCLYICSSEVFHSIGYFDEDYFMYGEDNDFFTRLTRAGYSIIETTIPVWHYGEGSSQNNKFMPTWLAYRNALRFALKNESFWGILMMLVSLLNQGCNIFLKESANGPNFKRLRRYNPVINFALIVGSVCWNISKIIPTLKSRYYSNTQR